MAKKRANGDGNIRKRADGRWKGRYTAGYGILCGQRQSLAKAAPAKDLSFLDTQIQPAKSHFARQNHTAVVTTKTMYYYSCFFRRYPVK